LSLQEGAASAQEIDAAMRDYGWPMGPFTLMDFLGLDVCADVGAYLSSQYGDRMQGAEMFERLVKAGRLGEKSGAGFYSYGDKSDEPVKQIIAELSAGKQSEFTPERLMCQMFNEAARCVEEGIADTKDIDMSMIAGSGMMYKGDRIGPLALADKLGLDVIVKGLEEFERKYGLRFHPCNKLYELVKEGRLGEKTKAGFLEYI